MTRTAQPAVLDACVLVPPGLRDLLLSCAHVGLFRPVWQDEILAEVRRNSIRLMIERKGMSEDSARAAVNRTLAMMANAFPDACCASDVWVPLVPGMTCDPKDRHVLAVAVGSGASHLVTDNVRDFPAASLPRNLAVTEPDHFMLDQLAASPELIADAVGGMSRRMTKPRKTPWQLAKLMMDGRYVPRFGAELLSWLEGSAGQ